jgi:hypothetical protein
VNGLQGGGARYCAKVQLSDLGLGVRLYFGFLRALMVTFAVLVFLNIPAYLLYSSGTRIKQENRDFLALYAVTLGNLGLPDASGGWTAKLGGSTMPLDKAGDLLMAMDFMSCLVFMLFIVYCAWRVRNARKEKQTVSAKDYAVYVTGLPRDAKKKEIIRHFSALWPLNGPDWKGRPPPLGPMAETVMETTNTGDERYKDTWLAEVRGTCAGTLPLPLPCSMLIFWELHPR